MVVLKKCRHCSTGNVCRPRGLCWTCYYAPGVRDLYLPVSMCGRRGTYLTPTGPAAFATTALPGTEAKIEVMRLRAGLRQEIHHLHDARVSGG